MPPLFDDHLNKCLSAQITLRVMISVKDGASQPLLKYTWTVKYTKHCNQTMNYNPEGLSLFWIIFLASSGNPKICVLGFVHGCKVWFESSETVTMANLSLETGVIDTSDNINTFP